MLTVAIVFSCLFPCDELSMILGACGAS